MDLLGPSLGLTVVFWIMAASFVVAAVAVVPVRARATPKAAA